jgi:hypothetical protein
MQLGKSLGADSWGKVHKVRKKSWGRIFAVEKENMKIDKVVVPI